MRFLACFLLLILCLPAVASAQVLGSCGTEDADKAAPAGWQSGDEMITTGKEDIGRY